MKPAVGVFLRDRDHEAQVRFGHLAFGSPSLGLPRGHLLVDLFQVLDRDADLLLHALDLGKRLENRRLDARQRLGPRVARAELGGEPAFGAFGAGEDLDEMRARHLSLVDRDVVDLALVAPNLVDQAPHAIR